MSLLPSLDPASPPPPQTLEQPSAQHVFERVVGRPETIYPGRQFIELPDRKYSRETDLEILSRSVDVLLKQQDDRGSFYTDEDYRTGDRVDDQLGAASMIAYWLSVKGIEKGINDALERAVRFHLDHLVSAPTPAYPFRHSCSSLGYESASEACGNMWILWGGALVLQHGLPYLSKATGDELRDLMADTWSMVSADPNLPENPCANQWLAYCEVGVLYALAAGRDDLVPKILDFYKRRVRRLRILDRGHLVYGELNHWDAHYGLLSWMMIEYLHVGTGDPVFAEDAAEMALYFNERVSASGYYWGGSRNNECKMEEFLPILSKWSIELELNRLLLPPPSNLWRQMVIDGHYGRGLITRLAIPLESVTTRRVLPPTPWHFRLGDSSVCLRHDVKLHHLSAAGLDIIPAASALDFGSGLTWLARDKWKIDPFQVNPPRPSEAHRYIESKQVELCGVLGLASTQRGFYWETRQWWISSGNGLLWIGHLFSHTRASCERLHFVLGNPVVTRQSNKAVPVTEVVTAEGKSASTQGDPISISSPNFLRFGNVFIGATAPVEFIRPSRDAFHTFPVPHGELLRDFDKSNELRLHLCETPMQVGLGIAFSLRLR